MSLPLPDEASAKLLERARRTVLEHLDRITGQSRIAYDPAYVQREIARSAHTLAEITQALEKLRSTVH